MEVTCKIDTAGLERAIPELVAFGRRTLREQCVTSLAIICLDAQELTPAVEISRIDAELDAADHVSKSKVAGLSGLPWTVGMMIAAQRTNPNSPYSLSTGNRWPLAKPTGPRGSAENWRYFIEAAERMKSARHSSTHFLQHGWTPGIRILLANEDFVGWKSRGKSAAAGKITAGNTLDPMMLGTATVQISGDSVQATATNDVGDGGNAVLAAQHRAALIEYGTQPAQAAMEREEVVCGEKIAEYLERGFKQDFGYL
jgi:hypothetical protein